MDVNTSNCSVTSIRCVCKLITGTRLEIRWYHGTKRHRTASAWIHVNRTCVQRQHWDSAQFECMLIIKLNGLIGQDKPISANVPMGSQDFSWLVHLIAVFSEGENIRSYVSVTIRCLAGLLCSPSPPPPPYPRCLFPLPPCGHLIASLEGPSCCHIGCY